MCCIPGDRVWWRLDGNSVEQRRVAYQRVKTDADARRDAPSTIHARTRYHLKFCRRPEINYDGRTTEQSISCGYVCKAIRADFLRKVYVNMNSGFQTRRDNHWLNIEIVPGQFDKYAGQ